jgi:uncharacterized membrane protein
VTWLQRLRDQFWFLPALLCTVAAVLAETLVRLDRVVDAGPPPWTGVVLYEVGESGSRTVLSAIATSSLAVAGTTFSITMAVLALTSSSYGPRLVRNFMADRGNQAVLGVFTATFLYSILVLRAIGAGGQPFVPQLAVGVAVVLAVLDVAVLVYFIHHISDSVQIATLSRQVREDLGRAVDLLYPEHLGRGPDAAAAREAATADREAGDRLRRRGEDGRAVLAARAGYLTTVTEESLLTTAAEHDLEVVLEVRPGCHLIERTPLLRVHPADVAGDVVDALRRSFVIGDRRTPYQDVEFVVQQLTELAVRALSPGINDPYTAVNALEDLTAGLSRLAERPQPSPVRRDPAGRPRVLAPRADPADIVAAVLDAMRWYGAGAPPVMHATLRLVEEVTRAAGSSTLRGRLHHELGLLRAAFAAAGHHADDVAAFEAHADRVERVIMLG